MSSAAAVIVIRHKQKQLISYLKGVGATSEITAVSKDDLPSDLRSGASTLLRASCVRSTPDDKYFFDQIAFARDRSLFRGIRVLLLIFLFFAALVAIAIAIFL